MVALFVVLGLLLLVSMTVLILDDVRHRRALAAERAYQQWARETIVANLERVMTPQGIDHWWYSRSPALDLRTPTRAIRDGDIALVVALTESYLNPTSHQ